MTPPRRFRTVREALAAGPTFSFEFFPPRDDESERQLWEAIRRLEKFAPSFVSVTYGAGGTTRTGTLRATERIATETTMLPVAHLTGVNHSVDELRNLIGSLAGVGVRNMLAVRGDPPGDPEGDWLKHPEGIEHADELVSMLRAAGEFSVGVAAFPYKHPRSSDIDSDARHFVQKCRAGADYAITQIFFDVNDYFALRDRVSALGCEVPIIAGIMPVLSAATIDRAPKLSGAPFPQALRERFESYAGDPKAVREFGIAHATAMCERLLAEGAPGIHFITMNRSKATTEIWESLNLTQAASASA